MRPYHRTGWRRRTLHEDDDLLDLPRALAEGDRARVEELCRRYGLEVVDGRVRARDPQAARARAGLWQGRQLVRKVLLNSVYGALLNRHCRFHDRRIGASVTLSGRVVLHGMAALVGRETAGEARPDAPTVVYGDTDSCYFVAPGAEDPTTAAAVHERVAQVVNEGFPTLARDAFGVPPERSVLTASRELLADRGWFVRKKRYALRVIERDGRRLEPPRLKVVGFESRRSDTAPVVQRFLDGVLERILDGADRREIDRDVRTFRAELFECPPWLWAPRSTVKTLPAGVAALSPAELLRRLDGHDNWPGHVRAALAWNALRGIHGERAAPAVVAGAKVAICRLRPNRWRVRTVALPVELEDPPAWFAALPFDRHAMFEVAVASKVRAMTGDLAGDDGGFFEIAEDGP